MCCLPRTLRTSGLNSKRWTFEPPPVYLRTYSSRLSYLVIDISYPHSQSSSFSTHHQSVTYIESFLQIEPVQSSRRHVQIVEETDTAVVTLRLFASSSLSVLSHQRPTNWSWRRNIFWPPRSGWYKLLIHTTALGIVLKDGTFSKHCHRWRANYPTRIQLTYETSR